ncbi:hypothetical protein JCM3774_006084 [Rhodotorula dairenensis]
MLQDRQVHKTDPNARTVAALSLVNKRLRQLALPYLITKVTGRQLRSMTFRYGKISKSLLAQIRCLDLGHADEGHTLAAAQSLHLFDNIQELVDFERPFLHGSEHSLARDIFKNRAASITSVTQGEYYSSYDRGVRLLLEAVSVPASLKKLHLRQAIGRTFFLPHEVDLALTLAGHDALEELIIEEDAAVQSDIPERRRAEWIGNMRLPALKTLKLPVTSFAVLDLVKAWVPGISTLTIVFAPPSGTTSVCEGLDADRCFCFSDLCKLSLEGPLDVFKALEHLDLPRLQELDIEVTPTLVCDADFVDFDPSKTFAEMSLPRGVRFDLHMPHQAILGTVDWEPFQDECAARGVAFRLYTIDSLAAYQGGFLTSGVFPPGTVVDELSDTMSNVVLSATDRLQWLESLQDVAGLSQMAEAVSDLAMLEWASRV